MSLVPCGHRILVKPQRIEDVDSAYKSAKNAGIILQESHEQLQQAAVDKGTVIALGNTAYKDFGGTPWCEIGDLVAYARYGGKVVKDPQTQEDFLILNDEDIICTLLKD